MFLKPYSLTAFGKNILVLPEDIIFEEIKDLTSEKIETYISDLLIKFANDINKATYYQIILWASDGQLNADIWTFELKSWDYNTDINVLNFTGLELDKNTSIVTNKDGLLILAENEKARAQYKNIEDFINSFAN